MSSCLDREPEDHDMVTAAGFTLSVLAAVASIVKGWYPGIVVFVPLAIAIAIGFGLIFGSHIRKLRCRDD